MGTAQLRDRVVAEAQEDALVQFACALPPAGRKPAARRGGIRLLSDFSEDPPPQRARVARVAREQRALDLLGQVSEREHGPVEVGEERFEQLALARGEALDRWRERQDR